ncbi:MAG: M28 family peptidase [Bacteroidales bacterium]
MRRFRYIIAAVAIVATAFVAYGLFTLPKPAPADSDSFSAERAAVDIKAISQKPHSIEHPENREVVHQYWIDRLSAMEGVSPITYRYDSVAVFREVPYDIENIYCKIDPIIEDPDNPAPAYVLLIAHTDSRYTMEGMRDSLCSLGAADDGYGCAVTVENIALALKYRGEWRQGVKLLLTDSEEYGLNGIKTALDKAPEIFENVGLVINIDARGVKGPALLFETGRGNSKVMDLYEFANYPYTYTFTTVIYRMMPNFTDYTPLKETYPGMNFSTVDDINHYHNEKDNFNNISLYSIQHYGAQIEPVLSEYLTNHEYRDANCFKSESDNVAFTIPLIGLLNFSKGGYALVNAIVLALFCLVFCFSVMTGRIKAGKVFIEALKLLGYSILAFGCGTLIAFVFSKIEGVKFNFMGGIVGIQYDEWIMICSVSLMLLIYLLFYRKNRKRSSDAISSSAIRKSASASGATKYSFKVLYGILIVDVVLAAASYIFCGENFLFMVPVAVAAASLLLWRIIRWRGVIIIGVVTILLLSFSFCYVLSVALSLGALGVTLMMTFLYLALIVPMVDLYCRKEKII